MTLLSRNPATGEVLERFEPMSAQQVDDILDEAQRAFGHWRNASLARRGDLLQRLAVLLREGKSSYARTMALEMGKPITQGEAEVEKCAWVCEYYAESASEMLAESARTSDGSASFVRFDPLGPLLAIMPWNYPMWQVFRFLAPALAAGNAGLLKHAPNVCRSALAIEHAVVEAGFPEGLFRALLIDVDAVPGIIDDPRVAAVSLTGSERAGMSVAETAGRALKKVVLELGGSDPFIVLEDADLERASIVGADARLVNGGQSCIAGKRFIVAEAIADEFVEKLTKEMSSRRMGDPLDRLTDIGPQARWDLRENCHRQVSESIRAGARCLTGGEIPQGPGAYYPPTVLVDVTRAMPVACEEVFGPAAAVFRVAGEEEALALANDTRFGLGSSVWTRDPERALRFSARIEAGAVFVNGMTKSDPRLPFGGVKGSGFGRELAEFGILEFVNVKTVWIA